ncbi:MAG: hypothetical protein GYA23_00045 [Methanomicrobiales archaeon]|nr:hypothetical protein [Methanomicrobiales archaeon]
MYGIAWIDPCPGSRALHSAVALAILGIFLAALVISPAHARVTDEITPIPTSKDLPAQDNPELIGPIKTHVAYVGQTQDARMEGVISYIDVISNGSGSENLREIQADYLAVAASIPLMHTADDITEARAELQRQSRLFSDETKAQLVMFNGSSSAMRDVIAESVRTADSSITDLNDSLWLAQDTARLVVFKRESRERAVLLHVLNAQGVDISRAQNISDQIDSCKADLQNAMNSNSVAALKSVNGNVRLLTREFRSTISQYRFAMQVEAKRTAILSM